jgi:hypothetical protein
MIMTQAEMQAELSTLSKQVLELQQWRKVRRGHLRLLGFATMTVATAAPFVGFVLCFILDAVSPSNAIFASLPLIAIPIILLGSALIEHDVRTPGQLR